MIRLVHQFDPPARHASVATATCSSCSSCCCCCCVVSGVAMATFAAVNMSASARRHEKQPGWYLIRWIVVLSLTVVLLPVIGASLALASLSPSSSGGFLVWPLVGIAVLGAVFVAFYRSTGERHPVFAGLATAVAGLVLSTAEGLAILNVPASTGDVLPGVQLVVYLLLVVLGAVVAVWVGRRVGWPQR